MPVPFSGGCACGAIRYSCASKPRYMGNCHCRDCQQATGGAFFAAVVVKASDFSILSGEPSWFEKPADRGHIMRRAFCSDCGSPLFIVNESNTNARALYAGSLDDPSWYEPSRNIYVASAQPWDLMHPDLPKDDGMPDW
ncbi:MAG TPA: aldehyde-activating protein [Alphaproteobacteria bacterium]|nr:aldehyde-activating protein [Alphaproteobacteria bacterium]